MNRLQRGQQGFTLLELLVVIAILGILAAVAMPMVIGFIDEGHIEAAATELRTVQLATHVAMARAGVATIDGGYLGNVGLTDPPAGIDLPINGTYVGDFITGDAVAVEGHYEVATDGEVTQVGFPGL